MGGKDECHAVIVEMSDLGTSTEQTPRPPSAFDNEARVAQEGGMLLHFYLLCDKMSAGMVLFILGIFAFICFIFMT